MLKKIINWTFGSFFRTIGRLLVYIIIGYLLSILLSNYDISGIFNILEVHADTILNTPSSNNPVLISYNMNKLTNDGGGLSKSSDYLSCSLDLNYGSPAVLFTGYFPCRNNTHSSIYVNSNTYFGFSIPFKEMEINHKYTLDIFVMGSIHDEIYDFGGTFIRNLPQYQPYDAFKVNSTGSVSNSLFAQPGGNLPVIKYTITFESTIKDNYILTYFYNNTNNQFYLTGGGYLGYRITDNGTITDLNDINNTLNNDNTDESQNTATNFFNNFNTNNHGLTGIITAPLNAIQSLSSKTCTPLVLPLPYVNEDLTLPCMREIYISNFGDFMVLYDIITTGIVAYWVCVRIFGLVKDFKNPEHDEIEVVDL